MGSFDWQVHLYSHPPREPVLSTGCRVIQAVLSSARLCHHWDLVGRKLTPCKAGIVFAWDPYLGRVWGFFLDLIWGLSLWTLSSLFRLLMSLFLPTSALCVALCLVRFPSLSILIQGASPGPAGSLKNSVQCGALVLPGGHSVDDLLHRVVHSRSAVLLLLRWVLTCTHHTHTRLWWSWHRAAVTRAAVGLREETRALWSNAVCRKKSHPYIPFFFFKIKILGQKPTKGEMVARLRPRHYRQWGGR